MKDRPNRDKSIMKADGIQCLTSSFIRFIPTIRGSDNSEKIIYMDRQDGQDK